MTMMQWARRTMLIAGALCWATPAAAQENDATIIDRARWSELYRDIAQRMKVDAGELGMARLEQKPFFSWGNPVREGRTEGDFFIWFARSQPVLVGTIFSYDSPVSDLTHRAVAVELHGLTDQPLEVDDAPRLRWTAPANSVQSQRLKNTAPPRQRRVQRLAEMRRIAQRVEASTELLGQNIELRLVPTPLYRFERPEEIAVDEQVLDGGIFAMVTGTDPELLLIIQARRVNGDTFAWFLTTAGFTNLPLTIELDGQVLLRRGSAAHDPLYIDRHRIHVVPTKLGPGFAIGE